MATTKNITIFRYNFTDKIMTKLTAFAKLHELDDRHAFKDAWAVWLEINKRDIDIESENKPTKAIKTMLDYKLQPNVDIKINIKITK